jgi:hypothetical protein
VIWYDCGTMRLRSFVSSLVLLACAGCGTKIQEQYKIDVVTPGGDDYLAGATSAVLEIGTQKYTTSVTPGAPFTLSGNNLAINTEMAGIFRVKVLNAMGQVVAQGQSPEIELLLASPPLIRIFIQKPGSFGRTQNLDYPRRHMVAVALPAPPAPGSTAQARAITVAFFGLGTVLVPSGTTNVEQPSPVFNIYNPITHFIDDGGLSGQLGGARLPRTDASAVTHSDGRALIFGGLATATMGTPPMPTTPAPSSQLDLIGISRTNFDQFTPSGTVRAAEPPNGIPRARAAMVETTGAYVIGGIGDKETMPGVIEQKPLDTVVSIDPATDATYKLLPAHMAAPRVGHTATVVTRDGMKEVLIFGGAAADQPVAELLAGDMFTTLPAPGMVQRSDHAALPLPGGRVIIVGGRNDKGVLGDSVLYDSATNTLMPGPITLKTPRYEFASFVINDDVVVAGGYDAAGNLLDTAEIYSAADLHVKAVDVPCAKRAGASVVVLPNESVLLVGGTEPPTAPQTANQPSIVAEIYQPLR